MTPINDLRLSVVIPAHNEEQNLPPVIHDLTGTLRKEGIPYEIIVVNDNSSDGTADVIRVLQAEDPAIRTVDRSPPNGFGRAIRSGLDAVTGDVVVIYMADASDHPRDAVAYYRKICEGYDCVFGSRFIKKSQVTDYPLVKRVVNRIVNKAMQWLFWCRFNDLTNAFKAYRSYVIQEAGPFRSCHFNITIEMSLAALIRNYNIAQIPISWTGRTWGSSSLHLGEMGRRYLSTLVKAFAEKVLIADDLISERVVFARRQSHLSFQEQRLAVLEQRLDEVQQQLHAVLAPDDDLHYRPAA
jgi:dolichol-phosphate mannosyltransferase